MTWVPLIFSGYEITTTLANTLALNGATVEARQTPSPTWSMEALIPGGLTRANVRITVSDWAARPDDDVTAEQAPAEIDYLFEGAPVAQANTSGLETSWTPASFTFEADIVAGVLTIDYVPTDYGVASPIETFDILVEIEMELDDSPDPPVLPDTVSYNCACEGDGIATKTLLQLRQDILIEAGLNQQLAAPPTGTVLRINRILDRAQRYLFGEYEEFRNVRFFTWPLVEGVRFYDLPENADACTKRLDPSHIDWAGITLDGGSWQKLGYGIPPEFYSQPATVGRPYRYEIRGCIEVFPVPDSAGMMLRLKGQPGLSRFTEDTDVTSIDADAVFNMAMSMYIRKSDPQQADVYAGMALQLLEHRTAGGHGTARYIPGTVIESPAIPPLFLPLENE